MKTNLMELDAEIDDLEAGIEQLSQRLEQETLSRSCEAALTRDLADIELKRKQLIGLRKFYEKGKNE